MGIYTRGQTKEAFLFITTGYEDDAPVRKGAVCCDCPSDRGAQPFTAIVRTLLGGTARLSSLPLRFSCLSSRLFFFSPPPFSSPGSTTCHGTDCLILNYNKLTCVKSIFKRPKFSADRFVKCVRKCFTHRFAIDGFKKKRFVLVS